MQRTTSAVPCRPSPLDLQPPSFEHLTEAPSISTLLKRTVELSLAAGMRFPHTLFLGPPDSGKQVMAATIAAEMGVNLATINASTIRDAKELHQLLREVPDGAVVLVSQIDRSDWIKYQLCRIVAGLPVAEQRGEPRFEVPGDEWRSAVDGHSYRDFSIIATSRVLRADHSAWNEWAQITVRTERTEHTESVRLQRVLGRLGVKPGPVALARLANHAVKSQTRTLMLARNIIALTEAKQGSTLELADVERALAQLGKVMLTEAERDRLEAGKSLQRQEDMNDRGLFGALVGSIDRSIDITPEVRAKRRNKKIRETAEICTLVILVGVMMIFLSKLLISRFIDAPKGDPTSPAAVVPAAEPKAAAVPDAPGATATTPAGPGASASAVP